ncbi:MAG: hypothetical protein M3046_08450 [Actinomycetota bacterium]|nr:hypothetical protein [Actinomycetota bacterium]
MLEELAAFASLSKAEQVAGIGQIIVSSGLGGSDSQRAIAMLAMVPALKDAGLLDSEQCAEFERAAEGLDAHREELATVMHDQFVTAGGEELLPALTEGALEIEPLIPSDGNLDQVIETLVARIVDALGDRRSYVICDATVGSLVAAMGYILDRSSTATRRARRAGAGTGLIAELPAFPNATVRDALDIRRELAPAVVKFRGAMGKLEGELADADPFDPSFSEELHLLWESAVAPELQDLEQRVRDNSGLRQLRVPVLADAKGLATGLAAGGLGVALGTGIDIAAVVGMAAGVTGNVALRHHSEKRAIRNHRFYLLHATEERLRNTA